ncbi:DUF1366 domain-containing protein [Streptococcus cameli]
MKLEFLSKSVDYVGGEPYQTRVVLGNSEGAVYPFFFAADFINKDNGELFDLAMEKNYQENFPQRAENEKFNLIGEKIAKYDELIEKSQKAIKDLEEATEEAKSATVKNEQAVNNAVSELTELVMGVITQFSSGELTGEAK